MLSRNSLLFSFTAAGNCTPKPLSPGLPLAALLFSVFTSREPSSGPPGEWSGGGSGGSLQVATPAGPEQGSKRILEGDGI